MGILYADDTCIASKSAEDHAKVMTTVLFVFEAAGLTVSENTEIMLLAADTKPETPDLTAPCRSSRAKLWAGNAVFYLSGLVNVSADIMPEIKQRIVLAWACYERFKRELPEMATAPFTLKVRRLKAEL